MMYLLIAVLCGSMSVILFKIFSRKGVDAMAAVTVNYFTAFVLGWVLNVKGGEVVNPFAQEWLPWSVVAGVLFIAAYVAMSRSTVVAGVAITSFSSRLSLIIPVLLSALLFGVAERPDWMAMAVIIGALALIIWGGGLHEAAERGGGVRWLLPLSVFLWMGLSHFMLKYIQSDIKARFVGEEIVEGHLAALTSAIFLSAMTVGVAICVVRYAKKKNSEQGKRNAVFGVKELLGGAVLGVSNFFSTYLVLYALGTIPAVVFFPVYNVGVVLLATVVGVVGFGERVCVRQVVGMLLAAIGIVLFFV